MDAAAAPWTTPTSPPRCTLQQANDGTVAGCVLMAGNGLPEDRGWPVAPFPEPEGQTVVPWVDLTVGMKELTVAKVQAALNKQGAALTADGKFGPMMVAAVRRHRIHQRRVTPLRHCGSQPSCDRSVRAVRPSFPPQ